MNVFAKFDEIPLMILKVIKETKRYRRYGHTVGRSDNVKTEYPPTNTVCGGYNYYARLHDTSYHRYREKHLSILLDANR